MSYVKYRWLEFSHPKMFLLKRKPALCEEMIWEVVDGLSNGLNFSCRYLQHETRNIILALRYFSPHSIQITTYNKRKVQCTFLFQPICCQLGDIDKTGKIPKQLNWH